MASSHFLEYYDQKRNAQLGRYEELHEKKTKELTQKLHQRFLQISFYKEPAHCLDLSSIDVPCKLLALVLTNLKPSTISYATTLYQDAFNWPEIFQSLKSLSHSYNHKWSKVDFYVIDFRSQLKKQCDRELLFQLDKESHKEAMQSGWLLKYWFGSPDEQLRNRATCLWRTRTDAIAGGKGPWHKLARDYATQLYDSIQVHALKLRIEKNVENWAFEPL